MNLLTDISIQHTYKGKKAPEPITFIMHPFQNTHGENSGLFEILRDLKELSKPVKRSAHVTAAELAELYARGLIEQYGIRLRLRPANRDYPDSPPGKKVPRDKIAVGSEFDRMIRTVDLCSPVSPTLRVKLGRLGVN